MKTVLVLLALIALVGGCTAEMISCPSEDVKSTMEGLIESGAIINVDVCNWNLATGEAIDYIYYTLPK